MDTTNPINLQLEAKRRLDAKIATIAAMLDAALADLEAAAYAETCFLDEHANDLGNRRNRLAERIVDAGRQARNRLGWATKAVNEWVPAAPGVRVASMGE